ncbi:MULTISPECIES: photosynthetic complex assembly protein PuhC [unclassified Tardiphaga]|uniref:photosynthetic complex assembly protein PuhC n=1 Tax=unclassified Tardiphaga TaxID=2631404 RepID=UPI001165284B|nr:MULTISPECIES: photosynthetic complex assembly protein PuhC [unclassified Tardiphaga]MBC7584836.1 phosphonate-binding protein [Tardiphaga sp.]QDM15683.1 phosphonate-binding protein [Tardiphaga sp. vice278]QDM20745.1 phosphonate-binding protein [Tardiphaga sp. vice154]
MSQALHEPLIAKGGILAGCGLVLFALVTVTTSRLTGVGEVRMTVPAAVESLDLNFMDGQGGAVLVLDHRDGQVIDTLPPGSNGFVRVVLRGLARERKLGDIGPQPPFRLSRHANGQLTLTDTSSGKKVDLDAFGAANVGAFARLMQVGAKT